MDLPQKGGAAAAQPRFLPCTVPFWLLCHSCDNHLLYISFYSVARLSSMRLCQATSQLAVRNFATGTDGEKKKYVMPFGLGKIFDLGEPDNLIKTNRQRKTIKNNIPDFLPDDLKKELDELEIDNIEDLDELEDSTLDSYNDLGLVPPVGTGTFASPILIPSRKACRAVGYVHPDSHAVFWFNIYNDNNTYYIKDLGLFFKMLHIHDESMAGGHH
jgi:hypothetical protein